jgi:hypothetical protein
LRTLIVFDKLLGLGVEGRFEGTIIDLARHEGDVILDLDHLLALLVELISPPLR